MQYLDKQKKILRTNNHRTVGLSLLVVSITVAAASCSASEGTFQHEPAVKVSEAQSYLKRARETKTQSESEMVQALAPRLSRSSTGLDFKRGRNGLTTVNLQGRFTHVTLAKRLPDGTVRYSCVDNHKAARAWLDSFARGKEVQ